jgi:hypothetical protein
MSNESLLKIGLAITVFCCIVFYHLSNYVAPSDVNLFMIYKMSQFAVIGVFVAFAFLTQIIPCMISWKSFIGGKYRGRSSDFQICPKPETPDPPHEEEFAIKQTLFETTIDGMSKRVGEPDTYSTWHGRRFHVQGNTHYFGIIITTPNSMESGVLQLTLTDGKVAGFYFSGDPTSTKQCRLSAWHVETRKPRLSSKR